MAREAWPTPLRHALVAYADALEHLFEANTVAAALREELRPSEPCPPWGDGQTLSAWHKFRPHALLARIANKKPSGGMFTLWKSTKSPSEVLDTTIGYDPANPYPWDELARHAACVETALKALPQEVLSLAWLGESLESWPAAPPHGLPETWPKLRDVFIAAAGPSLHGPRLQAFVRRCLAIEGVTAEECLAAGPSPLAYLTYRALWEAEPELIPQLDPATLLVKELPADYIAEYELSEKPLGTLLRVHLFAAPPKRPLLRFSAGAKLTRPFALVPMPADGSGLPPGATRERVLEARLLSIHALRQGLPAPAFKLTTEDLAWLEQLKGKRDEDTHGWHEAISHAAGLQRYPEPTEHGPRWPSDVPLAQPGTVGVTDNTPVGTIVAVERETSDPATARFTISLGPGSESAAKAAYELWNLIRPWPKVGPVARVVDQVWRGEMVESDAWLAVCDVLLPHLQKPDDLGNQVSLQLQRLLQHFQYQLIPTAEQTRLQASEVGQHNSPIEAVLVFRLNEPAGQIFRIRRYGLLKDHQVIRTAEVSLSVGMPPPHLSELEKLLPLGPAGVAERLQVALAGLRPAALHGYLEQAMIDLFTTFWSAGYSEWCQHNAESAQLFDRYLRQSLAQSYGLNTFEPRSVLEHPDGWVNLPPGTRISQGRVKQILAPGLVDRQGSLRLPALVLAD